MRGPLVVAILLVALTAAVPTAEACCHLYEYRQDVGPCHVEWRGDGFDLYTEYVEAGCLGTNVRAGPISR